MFTCLKGCLPLSWTTRNTHYPLPSQTQDASEREKKNHASNEEPTARVKLEVRAITFNKVHVRYLINIKSEAALNTAKECKASTSSADKSTAAFRHLTRWLDSPDDDAAFWWQTTGSLLGLLLSEASYDLHSQYQALLFYHRFIAPALGPRPTENRTRSIWKSYMTDDHTPVEFSWNWRDSKTPPKIRCTMEAIPSDIASIDPFNQDAVIRLVRSLRVTLPYVDWHLFDYLANAFHPPANSTSEAIAQADSRGYRSTIFLGFEFEDGKVAVKAYFAPVVGPGDTQWKTIVRSIKALEAGKIKFPALLELENFLAFSEEGNQLKVEGLAIDCVDLKKSRLKIYARTPLTSFDSVRQYMTMRGKLSHSDKTWKQLRDLWGLVLGIDESFPANKELPFRDQLTAGMMYNYDTRAGNSMPEPKLYINTRHYGRSDLDIARGLAVFMQKYGRGGSAPNYQHAVDGFCTYRALDRECGLQTYVSCAVQDGALALTSYLSPQTYYRLEF